MSLSVSSLPDALFTVYDISEKDIFFASPHEQSTISSARKIIENFFIKNHLNAIV